MKCSFYVVGYHKFLLH